MSRRGSRREGGSSVALVGLLARLGRLLVLLLVLGSVLGRLLVLLGALVLVVVGLLLLGSLRRLGLVGDLDHVLDRAEDHDRATAAAALGAALRHEDAERRAVGAVG